MMRVLVKTVDRFLRSTYLLSLAFLSVPLSFLWYTHASDSEAMSGLRVLALVLATLVFIIAFFAAQRTNSLNARYGLAIREIYEMSCIYNNALNAAIQNNEKEVGSTRFIELEGRTLEAVCVRINRVFELLTERGCVTTIKLVVEDEGKLRATTYVRSELVSRRDEMDEPLNLVKEGSDTALDRALVSPSKSSKPPHFFSANLLIEPNYSNSRENYFQFYRSTLVVPICSKIESHGVDVKDLVGYLCIDSMSINRLDDGDHLYLASLFANQIFGLISVLSTRE